MYYILLSRLRRLSICAFNAILLVVVTQTMATIPPNNMPEIEFTDAITLERAIKYTLANSPDLHEFTFRQQAVDAELKTASLKPALNAGIEVENLLGTGTTSGLKEAELSLTLSSVIEFGDKIGVRTQFVKARSSLIEAQKQINTLDVLAEVTRRYIDVLAQQALVDVQKQAEELARYTYQAVAKRVEAGASPSFEQQRASAALARARLDVLTAEQSQHSMIKSLAIMWGEQSPTFSQVKGDLFVLPASPSLPVLFNNMLASPNLTIYAEEARLQQEQVRLTQASDQADLSWTAGIKHLSGIDEAAFIAGINMPLFAAERNLGEHQKQNALLGQLQQQKHSATQKLYHQLNMALLARNNALLNVETLQSAILPPLQEALTWVEQSYIDGRFSYLEWVSTRQELLNAKQSLIQAAKQAHQRGADIESLTAQPLVASLNSSLSSTK